MFFVLFLRFRRKFNGDRTREACGGDTRMNIFAVAGPGSKYQVPGARSGWVFGRLVAWLDMPRHICREFVHPQRAYLRDSQLWPCRSAEDFLASQRVSRTYCQTMSGIIAPSIQARLPICKAAGNAIHVINTARCYNSRSLALSLL